MVKILCRSWNELEQCYYYFENGKYYELKGRIKVPVDGYAFNWNNAEQYIGFKDKNGNKIFEGDIVETDLVGTIRWEKSNFQYYIIYEDCYEYLDSILSSKIKLLGNIHDVK